MKHIPTVLLVIGLLMVIGFTGYFSYDLFFIKQTTISFEPVSPPKMETYTPNKEIQKQLMAIVKGAKLYQVRDIEFTALDKKKIDKIITEKKNALHNAPSDPQLLFELGYYSFLNHYNAQAITYLNKAQQANSEDVSSALMKAYILFKGGKSPSAKAILADLEKKYPSNTDVLLCQAIIYEKNKEIKRAKEYYTRVLQLNKRDIMAKKALVRLK